MSVHFDAATGENIQLSGPDPGESVNIVRNVSAYSLSLWIRRLSDTGDSQQIIYIQAQEGNNNSRFEFQFQGSAGLVLRTFTRAPDSAGAEVEDSATVIPATTFSAPNTHLVVISDPGNDLVDYYIDGVLDQSNTATFPNTAFDDVDADEVYIGSGNAGATSQEFDGLMDDLRGYARRLTPEEILHMYRTRGADGILPDFRWPMNQQPSGTVVAAADFKEIAGPQHFTNGQAFAVNNTPTYQPTNLQFRRRML
jgi:hypothetical protein